MRLHTFAGLRLLVFFVTLNPRLATADTLSLGLPEAKGNGCRNASVAAVLSPDLSQLSILFEGYSVETTERKRIERKHCDITIPVHVPSGETFSILRMDYRGYSFLPEGAGAILSVDYFLGQLRGRPTYKVFQGATDAPFTVTDTLSVKDRKWVPCGKDLKLHIDSSILVRSGAKAVQATMELDTLDVSSGLVYRIERKACR